MKSFKYKVRSSSMYEAIQGTFEKVRNQMEWKEKTKDKYSEAFIKLAVKIRNKTDFGYEEPPVFKQDLDNGNLAEPDAIKEFDKFYGTNYYPAYSKSREANLPYEKEDAYSTGTRDFGDDKVTIDCKTSTDKNVFDACNLLDLDLDYIFQINNYHKLYGTTEGKLFRFLAPKNFLEIERMVNQERNRITNLDKDDAYFDEFQEKYEAMYRYGVFDGYEMTDRIHLRDIPTIENFDYMRETAVARINYYIENYIL